MKGWPVKAAVTVLLWTALAPSAPAHRLDEFLQAATIAVAKDRVSLRMNLTPGAAVSRQAVAGIDTDGDGVLSEAEQRAYAERVCRDLSLTVDAARLPLRVVSFYFPKVGEIQEGLGIIALRLEAEIPSGAAGSKRRLIFENRHQSGAAAYLVNCLLPDDPGIHITGQDRSNDQSFYQLDYTLNDTPAPGVR